MSIHVTVATLAIIFVLPWVAHCEVCKVGSDCPGPRECCLWDSLKKEGYCAPMRRTGWTCYRKQPYAYDKPEKMVTEFDACPCEPGEFCTPINRNHFRYGPMGVCSFGRRR